jgi:hypothetical protein
MNFASIVHDVRVCFAMHQFRALVHPLCTSTLHSGDNEGWSPGKNAASAKIHAGMMEDAGHKGAAKNKTGGGATTVFWINLSQQHHELNNLPIQASNILLAIICCSSYL